MSKKHHHESNEEGGAWEIALADLMTTLMVFFLVMWLLSIVDSDKRNAFVNGLMGKGTSGDVLSEEVTGEKVESESINPIAEIKQPITTDEIKEVLSEVDPKDIDIEETEDYTKITLRSDSFFESGRASITDKTREQLEQLGESLAGRDQGLTITGYTDSIPIKNLQFPSNWELSAARAATVARTFIYMGVESALVTIEGKADNEPVAPNTTAYGRSLNRRVIILVNKKAQTKPDVSPIPH
ncbi:MAG: cell envelope biogenesis protein OmpA [Piscirickettsiaceae bacterium CG_4_9_14_3_um_filter_43_564]|nr:flagellar motor protein MotB [Thiomicrospira sp.]PIQ04518.1 MAG: cell envelope biogenesis protein OmpA [Piscirickettsiaceae bacterium CG18_big_fil_WC_8_21_14_2_50_44_103]PIU38718.1 MAG: cell envelope biogenesis protein OmpA [Piscirickettsiaceae bacterium CG07_land_8_20_14_0_80_44_28]PIW58082.1 MAG: cell envelope biogenesis protein OmpA [Piscirickettsiaceae bacterium CG12_big_fil_rev_8_21_14_0_65_44_934]PIW78220.1 MAG: cell envelope biogenesis protein OmpA [Piscirickettsiaceae bacterium CG_4_